MSTPPVFRVMEREALVLARLWRGMVFSTLLAPVLFLAAMGLGLGGLVNDHTGKVAGLTYLDFVAPGLMVASAMQLAANEAMWPVLGAVKWIRNFHATVATSITAGEVLVGYLLWIVVRALVSSTVFLAVAALLGAVPSAWGVLAIPAAALCAAAFAAPLAAYSVTLDTDLVFPVIMRVAVLPLFLFSGTFFPISQLPAWLQPLAVMSPLWHGVELARGATTGTLHLGADIVHIAVLVACVGVGLRWGRRTFAEAHLVSSLRVLPPLSARKRSWRLVERNVFAYRRTWWVFLSGLFEPVLFLLSIGIGVGKLVGKVPFAGHEVDYKQFVAPGLLASAAMNGSLLDTTFNFFVKFKYSHTYDAILATPLATGDVATGEVVWALMRGAIYSTAFLLTMLAFALVPSWWAILAVPVAVLIGFAFAGAGLAGTTFMRSWVDFDYVTLALIPLFLFSATFFPLSQYPAGLQAVIRVTPLYQGVVLERSLVLGDVHPILLVHVAYLALMGAFGLRVASRRIGRLLQP